MGKIRFQPPPKSLKEERDGDQIPRQVQIFTCSLIYASVYIYRYYIIPQAPDQSRFHCHVLYENAVSAPLRGAEELEENVGIFLQENYEHISVPKFSNSDAANIIHDFNRGLTAYHDI
ncbi:hypothetical protein MHYP_G00241120 [Metynnis hypsauchen]